MRRGEEGRLGGGGWRVRGKEHKERGGRGKGGWEREGGSVEGKGKILGLRKDENERGKMSVRGEGSRLT